MGKQNFYFLGQLIGCHFNQDYAYINDGEDTIEGIIQFYKKTADEQTLSELKKELYDFIEIYSDILEKEFEERYGFDFSPALWETAAYDFLKTILRIISD